MSDTTHLKLPLIGAAQSQKHVTHNEAIRDLDLLVTREGIKVPVDEVPA